VTPPSKPSSALRPRSKAFSSSGKPPILRLEAGLAAVLALSLAAASPPSFADEDEDLQLTWTRFQGRCDQALEAGRYPEAVAACKRAVGTGQKLEEKLFMDTSLNNLALAYLRQRLYFEAEVTLKLLLEIRAETLGPDHPLTASGINLLAAVYHKQGRAAEAKQLEGQFAQLREACGGQLDDDAQEQIAEGAIIDPCNPLPVPDFLR
jgi:tetratricopeptide (TPR) repeat protein